MSAEVAVITGAGGGIGAAVVDQLLRRGFAVAAADVAMDGLERLKALHPRAPLIPIRMDVTDRGDVERAAEEVIARWGRVDALVTAAGVFARTPALKLDDAVMRRVLAVNLEGALRSTAVFGRYMNEAGGRIVYVGSMAGAAGAALASAYAAAKAGLVAAAQSAARELAPRRITVNVVAPGFCDTPMLAPDRAMVERFTVQQIPARRLGRPQDVAEAVAFFVCSATDYLTGSVLTIDGGLHVG